MAIRVADYYARHLTKVRALACALAALVMGTLIVLIVLSGAPLVRTLTVVCVPMAIMLAGTWLILLRIALEPLEIISRAIAHVAPETNDVTPPIINEPRLERSGLKQLVQTVYDLSASSATSAVLRPDSDISPDLAEHILESLPAGIIALDTNGDILYHNTLAPVVTDDRGTPRIELLFEGDATLDSWLAGCATDKVTDTHAWPRIANKIVGEEGRSIYDVTGHYQKGAPVETVLLLLDRTSNYTPDEEDMDFIALAAHELRGPITVIRGYLDVLQGEIAGSLRPDQVQLLERLNVSAARLSGYVGNILNVSRYDRRHLKVHLHEDTLSAIYDTVADDMQLRASTQGRMLSVDIPNDLPTIAADRNSLSEVMMNLIDNAIKYSNEGGQVVVHAAVDRDFVTVSVTDHGIGIPSGLVGSLFTKFYRSHRSRQSVQGTGLGLYISRGIIESHGGKIGLRTKEGEGSTFTFSVPVYSTVKDKLLGDNTDIIKNSSGGWIKNHSMYRS